MLVASGTHWPAISDAMDDAIAPQIALPVNFLK